MNLRPPAYPLVTVDPYFSLWSATDKTAESDVVHWTGYPNTLTAVATVDGFPYRFLGLSHTADGSEIPAMEQVSFDLDALSTTYVYRAGDIELTAIFSSSQLPNDLYLLTRPVSYLEVIVRSLDGAPHDVSVKLSASEQLCLNLKNQYAVSTKTFLSGALNAVRIGSKKQPILEKDGDDLRIDWGYFYLAAENASVGSEQIGDMTYIYAEAEVETSTLFTLSYDDRKSINYFGDFLPSYWNRDGKKILSAIKEAHKDYFSVFERARAFSDKLFLEATRAGGEEYAEMLSLAFRQVLGGHKLAVKKNGELVYISKECYSNGCAATVDVSYPSIPLYLLYNPELVLAMMRPIYDFASSDAWKFDFAPHDAGCYPAVTGQRYGLKNGELLYEKQMPVEECGNMLLMEATAAIALGDSSFAESHFDTLSQWVQYLIQNGSDPENQLCTDDFAGHFPHNCNLSLKAIMGIAGYAILLDMQGKKKEAEDYLALAREMAADWRKRASNGDGSYRLAFDAPGTFSMKYNIVWDLLFGTNVMDKEMFATEVRSYFAHADVFGLPLDNRQPYTKSDWLVWTASLADDRKTFEALIHPMYVAFDTTVSRVPMTDWYYTKTALHKFHMGRVRDSKGNDTGEKYERSFRNRTVQGGLFMKLLKEKGILAYPL